MLKLYQAITIILYPLVSFYLWLRKIKGKEDAARFSERFGYASKDRPVGKLAWVHAASAGEAISILPLITKLSEQFPSLNFLLTTGTVNSAKAIQGQLPAKTIHQYVPADLLPSVKRFLKHWQPDLALFAESEIWPNLVSQTSSKCPLIMVNGHISSNSFQNWKKNRDLAKQIFGYFSLCMAQSKIDALYLQELGAKKTIISGNIKYDAPALPADDFKIEEIRKMIGNRTLWLAASTHNENILEEKIIADAHQIIKQKYPDLLTIIAPRHPARRDEILHELRAENLNITTRSLNELITPKTDIYLADTMGELGIFFRLADIVFIGGSLVPRGGHNPLEPARLNCAIIIGPHAFNFAEINHEFIKEGAIITVSNSNELAENVTELLTNKEKTRHLAASALELVNSKTGVIDKVVEEIKTVFQV